MFSGISTESSHRINWLLLWDRREPVNLRSWTFYPDTSTRKKKIVLEHVVSMVGLFQLKRCPRKRYGQRQREALGQFPKGILLHPARRSFATIVDR